MEFGKYRFLIKLEDDAILPYYKGSTFRGLLGHALKRVVCALRHQDCATCILKTNCTYALVFETAIAVSLPEGSRISAPPHPMVIEPPLTEQTHFKKGETMECTILLFGEINRNLPYFIYAFDQMGKIGMGKKIRGRRSRFVLESVFAKHIVLYENNERKIKLPKDNEHITFNGCNGSSASDMADMEVSLVLETPLRVNIDNRKELTLPFQFLVNNMIRRTTSLLNCYGTGEPELNYSALAQRAAKVEIAEENLTWHDWKRYSNRQERKMFMGGISGSIKYRGKIEEFLPMIEMAEKVHLGKNTFFGLGKITREK